MDGLPEEILRGEIARRKQQKQGHKPQDRKDPAPFPEPADQLAAGNRPAAGLDRTFDRCRSLFLRKLDHNIGFDRIPGHVLLAVHAERLAIQCIPATLHTGQNHTPLQFALIVQHFFPFVKGDFGPEKQKTYPQEFTYCSSQGRSEPVAKNFYP